MDGSPPRVVLPLGLTMDEVKYRYVTAQLEYLGYRDLTARSLRVSIGTLYRWLARWKVKFPRGLTRAQVRAQEMRT